MTKKLLWYSEYIPAIFSIFFSAGFLRSTLYGQSSVLKVVGNVTDEVGGLLIHFN